MNKTAPAPKTTIATAIGAVADGRVADEEESGFLFGDLSYERAAE